MKTQAIIVLLALFLASCAYPIAPPPSDTLAPMAGPTPEPASTAARAHITASPFPTKPESAVPTPDPGQLERWREYEAALGRRLLTGDPSGGRVICEWEVLGRSGDQVYVWAACMGTYLVGDINPGQPRADVPAVIRIDEQGSVRSVEIPGSGTLYARDIRSMFPPDAQKMIFDDLIDYRRLGDHLRWRLEHPDEPPLIVLDATPAP